MDKFPASANWSVCNESSSPSLVSWALPSHFSDSGSVQFHGFASSSCSIQMESCKEDRAESVSRSHRQAEKRRRDRINAHLAGLRKLIPNSDKMDKAGLLARVIEHVKELKQKAAETNNFSTLPTETDEVTVNREDVSLHDAETEKGREEILFRASLCCEDQPEVLSEIIRVINGLNLRTIRADIATVGGRMRSDLVLSNRGCEDTNVSVSEIKQSLSRVLNRISSSSSTASSCRIRSKRQRWFFSTHYS